MLLVVGAVLASILALCVLFPVRPDVDSMLQERLDALSQVEHLGASLSQALTGNTAALRVWVDEVDRRLQRKGTDDLPALAVVSGVMSALAVGGMSFRAGF